MSELRIALVAEGLTDQVVIEAALRTLLTGPFVLTLLQPEPTRDWAGEGWCGVFKWCREVAGRGARSLETDPTLAGFDLFVIHVDADVASFNYADGGPALDIEAATLPDAGLPCDMPCPPAEDSVDALRTRIHAWLGTTATGARTVLCVPSKSTDAWMAAALFDDGHALLQGLECNADLDLSIQPLATRVRKKRREYQKRQQQITSSWARVRDRCSQADRFSNDVKAACPDPQ